jgi:hypothetical protein
LLRWYSLLLFFFYHIRVWYYWQMFFKIFII